MLRANTNMIIAQTTSIRIKKSLMRDMVMMRTTSTGIMNMPSTTIIKSKQDPTEVD
jgi:hypothetical protein